MCSKVLSFEPENFEHYRLIDLWIYFKFCVTQICVARRISTVIHFEKTNLIDIFCPTIQLFLKQ
jgi:hypothetical protein